MDDAGDGGRSRRTGAVRRTCAKRRARAMAAGHPKMSSIPKMSWPRGTSLAAGHPLMSSGPKGDLSWQGIYGRARTARCHLRATITRIRLTNQCGTLR